MARRGARGAGRAGAHRAGPGQLGETLLHLAARNGHLEVAEKLLAAGVAVGANDKVRGPLAG
jgi:ankyrin repeat protein